MGIMKPPISNRKNEMEYIQQHHFVKKTEKKAITKHEPKEEPKFGQDTSFSIGDNTFHYNEPTSSHNPSIYNPNTFTIESSVVGVQDAIENGKDTDLVVMSVGEVRKMQERIRLLEKTIMKSYSNTSVKQMHNDMMLETERKRISLEQKIREHERVTDLKKMEIEKDMLNRNFKFK